MPRRTPEERREDFKSYIKDHPDAPIFVLGQRVIRENPYSATDLKSYMNVVDRHEAFFDLNHISHGVINSRRQIEDFSQQNLQALGKGGKYSLKCGDADFFTEEPGKWNQVGGEIVRETYKAAHQRGAEIRVVGSEYPVRKERIKARAVVDILNDIGVPLKVIDLPLRAILVTLPNGQRKAAVWYSTTETSEPYKSHDPDTSFYFGYMVNGSGGEPVGIFINSLEKTLKEIEERSNDAKKILDELDRLDRESRIRAANGADGKAGE